MGSYMTSRPRVAMDSASAHVVDIRISEESISNPQGRICHPGEEAAAPEN